MALTTCADCGRQVSESAASCPGCGRPLHAPKRPTTIQATSKLHKGVQAIGILLLLTGVVVGMAGNWGSGWMFILFGSVLYIVGRAGAWWNNG